MDMIITDVVGLNKIEKYIHDQWFDKNDIFFISSEQCVLIKFRRSIRQLRRKIKGILLIKKVEEPLVLSELRINFVKSFLIEDKAKIGLYCFNKIIYNDQRKILIITSDVPFKIIVEIDKVNIEYRGKRYSKPF